MPLPEILKKFDFSKMDILMPIEKNLAPRLPKGDEEVKHFSYYQDDPVTISEMLLTYSIMSSKEKPKKVGFIGSDRRVYYFLLKKDQIGDLRKEARFIDYANLLNTCFENDIETSQKSLKMHTYSIVPLSRFTGLIEWVNRTTTIKMTICNEMSKFGIQADLASAFKFYDKEPPYTNRMFTQWDKFNTHHVKDVFWHYFRERFPTPSLNLDARIKFIQSYSVWCIAGYIIGLGDRHCDNILLHFDTGESSHVDFDCIFEKGKKLPIPETVPFRLTRNILDVFGMIGERGTFIKTCEQVFRVLQSNNKNIIGFLSSFIHDPIMEGKDEVKADPLLDRIEEKLT
jgi:phosphatidylinositol kinase/protein kinase (PI-3  family)